MYALHIANRNYSSWSLRPWLLLRELGIDFDERLEVFGEGSNREAFRRFSPSGLVPCLVDDGLAVWDSLAITEYLAERHAGVWPDDARARAWARCAAAEMHSGFSALRGHCPMNCGVRARLHATPSALRTDLQRIDELWSDGLSRFGGPYLAGERFSAVDAFFAPVAFRAQTYGLALDEPGQAWVQLMLERPAMRAWYDAAITEPWREKAHEAELRAAADITADHRA